MFVGSFSLFFCYHVIHKHLTTSWIMSHQATLHSHSPARNCSIPKDLVPICRLFDDWSFKMRPLRWPDTKMRMFVDHRIFFFFNTKIQQTYNSYKIESVVIINRYCLFTNLSSDVSLRIDSIVFIQSDTSSSYWLISCVSNAACLCILKSFRMTFSGCFNIYIWTNY